MLIERPVGTSAQRPSPLPWERANNTAMVCEYHVRVFRSLLFDDRRLEIALRGGIWRAGARGIEIPC